MLSAGSAKPAKVEYQYGGQTFWRPSNKWVLAEFTMAMMTVGSVRGKERLEMRPRVAQEGRSSIQYIKTWLVGGWGECMDGGLPPVLASLGGHARLKPPLTDMVELPQPAQKGLREFQSRRARASA